MLLLRSLLFDLLFYTLTPLYLFLGEAVILAKGRPGGLRVYHYLTRGVLWGLKHTVGLTYRIQGQENLEKAQGYPLAIIASRHQSAWDTFIFSILFDDVYMILKKELTKVPILRFYVKRLDFLAVDRSQGLSTIRNLIQKVSSLKSGKIIIFSEGTRSLPGAKGNYQSGTAALYAALNVPVVPVILNSGEFWGRRSWIKKPGEIIIEFLPPIPEGLDRKTFSKVLSNQLDTPLLISKANPLP